MKSELKFLITGASGFVGSVLCRRLIEQNRDVHVILRKDANTWRINDLLNKMKVHTSNLSDLTILKSIIKKVKPDIIFHLATYGGYSFQLDTNKIFQTNILGTWNLLQACSEIPYKLFVNTGSSSEYGFKDFAVRETDMVEPASYYAVSKCTQTQLCNHVAKQENKPIVTLRLFSAYGPFEEPKRFVPTLLMSLLHHRKMKLVAPDVARDFIFVDDIVDVYLNIHKLTKYPGECFNIGSGIQSTIQDVVEKCKFVTKQDTILNWGSMKNRKWDTNNWVADISKARLRLNWLPKTTLESGLSSTYNWIRDNTTKYESYS